ncbi:MAG: 4-hydroxy-tetrahydrodipicolinate synthase, partial [Alphaproteobacteria bacterium]|nr:4-hydroxy-tetrahydrodipicolinate synthase [Alphaproteobacteria bacterium]
GCISVTANIAPRMCAEFFAAWKAGDAARALDLHVALMPLHDGLFVESNPMPVKYAMSLMGKCSDEMRLPLCSPSGANAAGIKSMLTAVGLLG